MAVTTWSSPASRSDTMMMRRRLGIEEVPGNLSGRKRFLRPLPLAQVSPSLGRKTKSGPFRACMGCVQPPSQEPDPRSFTARIPLPPSTVSAARPRPGTRSARPSHRPFSLVDPPRASEPSARPLRAGHAPVIASRQYRPGRRLVPPTTCPFLIRDSSRRLFCGGDAGRFGGYPVAAADLKGPDLKLWA